MGLGACRHIAQCQNIAASNRHAASGRAVEQPRILLDPDDLLAIRGGAEDDQLDVATDRALLALVDDGDLELGFYRRYPISGDVH